MRICVFTQVFPLLSESFVLDHVLAMRERGHEVDVVAEKKEGTSEQWDRLMQSSSGQLFYTGAVPIRAPSRLFEAARIASSLARKDPTRALRAVDVGSYGREALTMRILFGTSLAPQRPYDVIHCHFGPNGVKGLALRDMGLLAGPLVTQFHGHDVSSYVNKRLGLASYKRLFRKGDLFLGVSQRMCAQLEQLGADPARIRLQRCAVDTRKLRPVARENESGGPLQVISIARFVEKKGLEYGIRAVVRAARRGADVRYRIVGGGPLETELRQLVESEKASPFIELLGPKSHDEALRLLGEADVLLAPSVTAANGDQEGVPVAIMEAMALGLPVIGTRHAGIPEVIEDGMTGYLVPERDERAMAEAIVRLAGEADLGKRMGIAGRRLAESKLDRELLYDRLEREYETLIERHRQ